MKRCTQCGQQLTDDTAFCGNCGGSNFESVAVDGDNQQPYYQQPDQQSGYQQPNQQSYYQQPDQQPGYQQPNQQPYYQQPGQQTGYQQPYQPAGASYQGDNPARGKAVASLVLGIIALVLCWWGWVGVVAIILSVIGIILAIGARKELQPEQGRGMATGGLVCSIIALAISAIVFLSCVVCASTLYGLNSWY